MQRTLGNQEDTVAKVLWGKKSTVHVCVSVCVPARVYVPSLVAVSLLLHQSFVGVCTSFFSRTHAGMSIPVFERVCVLCMCVCLYVTNMFVSIWTRVHQHHLGFTGGPKCFFAKPVAVVFRLVFHHNSWSMLLPGLLAGWLAGREHWVIHSY